MNLRIVQFIAVLAMAIGLIGCGGNPDSSSMALAPAAGNPVAGDQMPAAGLDLTDTEKQTADWIAGYYVLTSSATYVDGIDQQFKLLGDNKGNYIWQLILTNNNWQPKTVNYGNDVRRYTFRIDQNGMQLWNSDQSVPLLPAGGLMLQPYVPHTYSLPWNGRDRFNRGIQGIVTATAIHRPATGDVTMSGTAWLNGITGEVESSEWPMFGGDRRHTSLSKFNGPQTNNVKWTFPVSGPDYSGEQSAAIGLDGTIYVGSGNSFYALNPDGTVKWQLGPNPGWYNACPAIGADGTVYVAFELGAVYAYDPDGTFKWEVVTGEIVASPVIGEDGTIYVVPLGGRVHAINPDGTVKWIYHALGTGYSSAAIGQNGTVYVASSRYSAEYKIFAINPNGTLQWSYATPGGMVSPAVGANGTIYVSCENGRLYAINPNGTLQWSFANPTSEGFISSPAIAADGTIYVGSTDHALYAVNQWGYMNWRYNASGPVSHASIGADGTIYFGAWTSGVNAVHPWGANKWTRFIGPNVGSAPAISRDGCMYIVCGDGKLYAFGS